MSDSIMSRPSPKHKLFHQQQKKYWLLATTLLLLLLSLASQAQARSLADTVAHELYLKQAAETRAAAASKP